MKRLGKVQYFLTAPVNLLLLTFIVLPAIYVLVLSFSKSTYGSSPELIGFSNYIKLLSDRYFQRAAWNTFIVVNAVVYIELALALILTALVMGTQRYRRLLITLLLMPYAVSEVVGILMMKFMFDPDVGVASQFLTSLGLPQIAWTTNPVQALALVVLLSVWMHVPFTFLIVYTARLAVPKDLYEAARVDGASSFSQFWHVTFPLLIPAILVALLFRYIFAFRMFGEVWLLTSGGPARQTEVLAVYLYKMAFSYYDFGVASATAWAMVLLSRLVASPYYRIAYSRMFKNGA
jgi:multiple sugar transport system permease protein